MCKSCGKPTKSKTGYCRSTPVCNRLRQLVYNANHRLGTGAKFYSFFDAEGRLIRFGETDRPLNDRFNTYTDKIWWPEVAEITFLSEGVLEDKHERRELEHQIMHELGHPKYNTEKCRVLGCGFTRAWAWGSRIMPPITQVADLAELVHSPHDS